MNLLYPAFFGRSAEKVNIVDIVEHQTIFVKLGPLDVLGARIRLAVFARRKNRFSDVFKFPVFRREAIKIQDTRNQKDIGFPGLLGAPPRKEKPSTARAVDFFRLIGSGMTFKKNLIGLLAASSVQPKRIESGIKAAVAINVRPGKGERLSELPGGSVNFASASVTQNPKVSLLIQERSVVQLEGGQLKI